MSASLKDFGNELHVDPFWFSPPDPLRVSRHSCLSLFVNPAWGIFGVRTYSSPTLDDQVDSKNILELKGFIHLALSMCLVYSLVLEPTHMVPRYISM